MIDPNDVPAVSADETLARYILSSRHIRVDQTLRSNAFMPPPNLDLSVTRHLSATDEELWQVGEIVAIARSLRLYGRGDFQARICLAQNLSINPDPIIPANPNHANVSGWPANKPAQKIVAQEIATNARYVPRL